METNKCLVYDILKARVKVKVVDRQVFYRGGPSHVQAFLHAVLFPSVRLLAVHPQQTRSRTLTVAVTHPGTNTLKALTP
jgi:hypothetical protein